MSAFILLVLEGKRVAGLRAAEDGDHGAGGRKV